MTREKSASIHNLFISAEQTMPNIDGHNIRVAERRILWSKLAQLSPDAESAAQVAHGLGQIQPPVSPATQQQQVSAPAHPNYGPMRGAPTKPYSLPSVNPEQVAEYNSTQPAPSGVESLEAKWRAGQSNVTPEQVAQWQQPQPGDAPQNIPTAQIQSGLARLQQVQNAARQQATTHQRPAVVRPPARQPAAKPVPQFDLRQTMDAPAGILQAPQTSDLGYTPGPGDPNYAGASENIRGLLKVADYLSKK